MRQCGIHFEILPQKLGCGPEMTCWRLSDWQADGVWKRSHHILLDRLGEAGGIDLRREPGPVLYVGVGVAEAASWRTSPSGGYSMLRA